MGKTMMSPSTAKCPTKTINLKNEEKKGSKAGMPPKLLHNYSTQYIKPIIPKPTITTKYVKKLDSTLQSNNVSRNSDTKQPEVDQSKKINIKVTSTRNVIKFHSSKQSPGETTQYFSGHNKISTAKPKADISMNLQIISQKACKANVSSILQPGKAQVNISIKEDKKPARTRVINMSETMKDNLKPIIKKEAPKKIDKIIKAKAAHDSSKTLNATFSYSTKTLDQRKPENTKLTSVVPSNLLTPSSNSPAAKRNFVFGEQALRSFKRDLAEYELKEILLYSEVYYAGKIYNKLKTLSKDGINNGFDDKKGFYLVKEHDHLGYRYEIISLLGNGSFGHVYKCLDYKTNDLVAIKILRNKEKFHKQGQVEIDIIKTLNVTSQRESQYVVEMKDHFIFRNHICISFEILSIDLFELIKNSGFSGFALPLVKAFAKQLLIVLDYMKRLNIIHCDLKPENILLRNPKKSAIKVIDFGTGCFDNSAYYTYIQSRYYRAPEIMIGIPYTSAIDMWSFGTILIELFCGVPIFSGEDESEQLAMIMEYKGNPPLKMLLLGNRTKTFFDSEFHLNKKANSKGQVRVAGSKSLESFVKSDDKKFIDFLKKCLEWDPEKRIKPIEAMNHEWIKQ